MKPTRLVLCPIALAFCLPVAARAGIPPKSWESYQLRGAPIACEIPSGWRSQEFAGGSSHPIPLDDRAKGWNLQEVFWEGQGYSRFLIFLKRAHLTLEYLDAANYPNPSFKAMDDFIEMQLMGDLWGEDEAGTWKGMRTRTLGRLTTKGYKSVHYFIELSGSEFIHLSLKSTGRPPGAGFEAYLPLFGRIKESLRLVEPSDIRRDSAPHEWGSHRFIDESRGGLKGGRGGELKLKGPGAPRGSGRVVGDGCTQADRDKARALRMMKRPDGTPYLGPDEDYICDDFERGKADALKRLKGG